MILINVEYTAPRLSHTRQAGPPYGTLCRQELADARR